MVWVLFVAFLAAAGGGGWQLYTLQEALVATRAELNATQDKLNKVTGEVSAADASISQSDSAIRSELKVVNSEIRKLWDVSNKRNRQNIAENKKNIESTSKKVSDVGTRAEQAVKLADAGKKNADQMQKKISEMEQMIKAVTAEQVVTNSRMISSLDTLKTDFVKVQQLVTKQQALQAEMKDVTSQNADLARNFSSYRTITNQRLEQLENSIRRLQNPPETGLSIE